MIGARHRAGRRAGRLAQALRLRMPEEYSPDAVNLAGNMREGEALLVTSALAATREAALAKQQEEVAWARATRAEAALTAALRRRFEAEEEGHTQLVAELHDTVAQSLVSAQWLAAQGGPLEAVTEEVRRAEQELRAVLAMTKLPLVGTDLARAVRDLCDLMERQWSLRVRIDTWPTGVAEVSAPVAVTVYRFFQEGLRNVLKHSGQAKASVGLEAAGEELVARVQDDGAGFDPDRIRPAAGRSLGLTTLNDRAHLVGGTVHVHSSPGQGTTLELSVPLSGAGGPQQVP